MLCNFIEIALRHGCSPVNLLHIFRTPFSKMAASGSNSNDYCFDGSIDDNDHDRSYSNDLLHEIKK